jgi:hypothetical protein
MLGRLLSCLVFDRLVNHSLISLFDVADQQFTDDDGRIIDIDHRSVEQHIDWHFRISRRHQVLWLQYVTNQDSIILQSRSVVTDEKWLGQQATLSGSIDEVLQQWLQANRLPPVPPIVRFDAAAALATANALLAAQQMSQPIALAADQGPLQTAYLRVLSQLFPAQSVAIHEAIVKYEPQHPVAQRNHLAGLLAVGIDTDRARHQMLDVVAVAPMYAKARLSVWGDSFGVDNYQQKRGLYHQGIAVSLAPADGFANHNFSVLLAEQARYEESYRWADRASIAVPGFGAAHLDCIRRLRQLGKPAQAMAEAAYRCSELQEQSPPASAEVLVQAQFLHALTYLDVGRRLEAIETANRAIQLAAPNAKLHSAFSGAAQRVAQWQTTPSTLAQCDSWDAHYRGDPGRSLRSMRQCQWRDEGDATIVINALTALGRDDEAALAFCQFEGTHSNSVLGDGRARLAAAKALLMVGELGPALEQMQIVQLRRNASRFEGEINRLLRLAACHPSAAWEQVVVRLFEKGAVTLARNAARDLADFVPKFHTSAVDKLVGERQPFTMDPTWIAELVAELGIDDLEAQRISARLHRPVGSTLRDADALTQEWWNVLVPAAKDRKTHTSGAVLAFGIALANYFSLCSGHATPLCGAYRHIATDALQLIRRARYELDGKAIRALLQLVERLAATSEWLFDTWLLRIERTLDLEAEQGTHLDRLTWGLPTVRRLIRGDERSGWELRLAMDLGEDETQFMAASSMFERCARSQEGGVAYLAWSIAAQRCAASSVYLDVHWLAAFANPVGVADPWLSIARAQLDSGLHKLALDACYRGVAALNEQDQPHRLASLARLEAAWDAAAIDIPFEQDEAQGHLQQLLAIDDQPEALLTMQWLAALETGKVEPSADFAAYLCKQGLGTQALARLGLLGSTAARTVALELRDSKHHERAFTMMRYASRRFTTGEDWMLYAEMAATVSQDTICADCCRQAVSMGNTLSAAQLALFVASLFRCGEHGAAQREANRLLGATQEASLRELATQTLQRIQAATEGESTAPTARVALETAAALAYEQIENGSFTDAATGLGSLDWGIFRAALAACMYRGADASNALSNRALDAAVMALARTEGVTDIHAALVRITALQLRDHIFLQTEPPPPIAKAVPEAEFLVRYKECVAIANHSVGGA